MHLCRCPERLRPEAIIRSGLSSQGIQLCVREMPDNSVRGNRPCAREFTGEARQWNRIVSEAEKLRKHVATLASFGGRALRTSNIGELLQEATQLVSDAVEVDLVKVLEPSSPTAKTC